MLFIFPKGVPDIKPHKEFHAIVLPFFFGNSLDNGRNEQRVQRRVVDIDPFSLGLDAHDNGHHGTGIVLKALGQYSMTFGVGLGCCFADEPFGGQLGNVFDGFVQSSAVERLNDGFRGCCSGIEEFNVAANRVVLVLNVGEIQ